MKDANCCETCRKRDDEWYDVATRYYYCLKTREELERVFGIGNLNHALIHELWKRNPKVNEARRIALEDAITAIERNNREDAILVLHNMIEQEAKDRD